MERKISHFALKYPKGGAFGGGVAIHQEVDIRMN